MWQRPDLSVMPKIGGYHFVGAKRRIIGRVCVKILAYNGIIAKEGCMNNLIE